VLFRSADVTIDQNKSVIGKNSFSERKLEVFIKNKQLGKLTMGQGDTASNGVIEEDLSGTGSISGSGFSALGDSLEFVIAGTNGAGSGVTVGDHFSNLDGLSRDDRMRYDTPSLAGFTASASWVDGDEYDLALRYGRDFNGVEVALAVAYWDAQTTDDKVGYGGSASVLAPFGTSLTLAYSRESLDLAAAPNTQAEPEFRYVKLGQIFKFADIGKTSVSIEYAETKDQNEDAGTDGSYWALAFEQDVKKLGLDIYATLGQYDLDLGSGVNTEDITIGGVGTRIKF